MKRCSNCMQWKDECEFKWRCKALGIRHGICRDCQKEYIDDLYRRHGGQKVEEVKTKKHKVAGEAGEYIQNYLSIHSCSVCGESDPQVLELHYRDGKGWIINNVIGGGNILVALQAEIANCVVLCASCRRRRSNDGLRRLKDLRNPP